MYLHEAITGKQERLIMRMNKFCRKKFILTSTPRLKAEATKYITENYEEFIRNAEFIKHIGDGQVIM